MQQGTVLKMADFLSQCQHYRQQRGLSKTLTADALILEHCKKSSSKVPAGVPGILASIRVTATIDTTREEKGHPETIQINGVISLADAPATKILCGILSDPEFACSEAEANLKVRINRAEHFLKLAKFDEILAELPLHLDSEPEKSCVADLAKISKGLSTLQQPLPAEPASALVATTAYDLYRQEERVIQYNPLYTGHTDSKEDPRVPVPESSPPPSNKCCIML